MKYALPRSSNSQRGRQKERNKERSVCWQSSICACIYFVLRVIVKQRSQRSRLRPPMKRKLDEHEDARKRLKMTDSGSKSPKSPATTSKSPPLLEMEVEPNASENLKGKGKKKEAPKESLKPHNQGIRHRRINKLVPPRPFPTVPTSVSATGPRSNHKEGKNLICVTRKTSLACYLRRCKDIIIKDG